MSFTVIECIVETVVEESEFQMSGGLVDCTDQHPNVDRRQWDEGGRRGGGEQKEREKVIILVKIISEKENILL